MKSITISRRLKFINQLLEQAAREIIVLQSADGEQFLLARISLTTREETIGSQEDHVFVVDESDDFDAEIAATRQNKALMAFLDERVAHGKQGKRRSLEEIRQSLGE